MAEVSARSRAFLVRQTDLINAAARVVAAQGGILHAKKAQFLAPWDCKNIISKAREAAPDLQIVLCERGSSFGYNNLIVDMLAIGEMQRLGAPVTIDATHAVQLPGADPRTGHGFGVAALARGRAGHRQGGGGGRRGRRLPGASTPIRTRLLCDRPSCLPLSGAPVQIDLQGHPPGRSEHERDPPTKSSASWPPPGRASPSTR